MAKKNRATFAKREKERARLSKQAEKRAKRQLTPDPNAASIPGPMPLMPVFGDEVEVEVEAAEPESETVDQNL